MYVLENQPRRDPYEEFPLRIRIWILCERTRWCPGCKSETGERRYWLQWNLWESLAEEPWSILLHIKQRHLVYSGAAMEVSLKYTQKEKMTQNVWQWERSKGEIMGKGPSRLFLFPWEDIWSTFLAGGCPQKKFRARYYRVACSKCEKQRESGSW